MRFAMLVLFLSACGRIATVVPIQNAKTWDEYCIQRELECLNDSTAGSFTLPILAPLAIFTRSVSGEEVVRNCQLQGELCRTRAKDSGASSLPVK